MLEKAAEKRKNRRTHTRNFTAGEVAASTHYLERTGIRGKKRWAVLLAVAILAIVILGNFVLTCTICGVLRITVDGTESFRFDDNGNIVFLKPATFSQVQLAKGLAPTDDQYSLSSNDQSILLQTSDTGRSNPMTGIAYDPNQLIVTATEVLLNAFSSLSLQSRQNEALHVDKRRVQFDIPTALKTLRGTKVVTNKISSVSDMTASAENMLFRGMGDVTLEGQSVNVTAASGITLYSQESITISGSSVMFPRLPIVNTNSSQGQELSLKLCACRTADNTTFRLFLSTSSCLAANNTHPCL